MKYLKTTKDFLKNLMLGGLTAILPLALLIFLFKWIINKVILVLKPIVALFNVENPYMHAALYLIVLAAIVFIFVVIGALIRTRFGRFVDDEFEEKIIKKIPGYTIIKDTVKQFFGGGNSFFSEVVLVKLFDSKTYMTGFITDCVIVDKKHIHNEGDTYIKENRYYTVFVPTGPNPTSGNIYHVREKDMTKVDISVEEAMKTIISCGSGSAKLVKQLNFK